MKRIAFYGKGGIGKSTVCANTAAALAEAGNKVLLIGCDPKADSTRTLMGRRIPTVLSVLEKSKEPRLDELLFTGFAGVACVEAGGPKAGVGCAGRGILTAIEELSYHRVFERDWDVILYDVLGDIVCGGFAAPMRDGFVDEVYIVTSSECMSLYAANNILRSVAVFCESSPLCFGGLIYNCRSGQSDNFFAQQYAERVGARFAMELPYANEIARSELVAKTVMEAHGESEIAHVFRALAQIVSEPSPLCVPNALDDEALESLLSDPLIG